MKKQSNHVYSLDHIKAAWAQYLDGQMKEVLVRGEKVHLDLTDPMPQGATAAAVVPTRKAMGFPEYLERKWIRD